MARFPEASLGPWIVISVRDTGCGMPKDVQDNPQRLFDVQLDLYQKYLRATEAVAHDNGVKSAYFLQPIPAWGKALTDAERRVVGDLAYGELDRRMGPGIGHPGYSVRAVTD